ncbi:cilia- and flagella-associated protein 61 [Takifugu rubripes]|uniref:cilia- and flagella-associated protein 61 n=1 Tax=Takifugu rubripes TaxID=31033 RepID=UPI00114576A3|nr:cilia- and flagella-associated protein 61 [Takifugu rubripes]
MRTLTSSSGEEETVITRRSESADAPGIDRLMDPAALALFGRVCVLHLLEKANLAVTLANETDNIVAHASFFDHPVACLVDQSQWETFLKKSFGVQQCTPLNTLFLHLFVAQPDFATASVNEILRVAFNAVQELEFICLVTPNTNTSVLDPALSKTFEPLQHLDQSGPQCSAFICHRKQHCPRLHIRPARAEDHGDIVGLLEEQTNQQFTDLLDGSTIRKELLEAQNEQNHMAVCESDGVIVGFISVTCGVDLKLLQDFDLSEFDRFYKRMKSSISGVRRQVKTQRTRPGKFPFEKTIFRIQLFVIDKNHELRSTDFIPYVFSLFPERDLCLITIPTASPQLQLLQSFVRLESNSQFQEGYVFHRSGLSSSSVEVRWAVAADRTAVSDLVTGLRLGGTLLRDLDAYYETCRDLDRVSLQAFVAQVDGLVVGILIIQDEQEIEYIRAHYNIENFIYFSHHRYEGHARMRHFVLRHPFQHFTKHLFKEVFRLSHKSCLYYRMYPPQHSQENSCIHHLDSVLNCVVPVSPRRQIIYPLEELGINIPSRQITEDQAPFALSLISRKLSLEPKLVVNSRIVVVGASDTGLSFLQVLSFCPHLKFNNLTLISTHGFSSEHTWEDVGFLSTSHAYSRRDLAQLPLHSCVTTVTGKMVAIDRKSKFVRVSGGRSVSYDHLILCTGLQYQVTCPTGVDLSQPITTSQLQNHARHRYTGPIPANLFTLNDPTDCMAARDWLCAHFLQLQDNAVVYGNSIDVFTTVETLQELGVQGHRIHVVLTAPEPGVLCFGEPEVEKVVMAALEKAEVQVHHHCLLALMNQGDPRPVQLTSVSFTTSGEPLHLPCGVFINLSNKGVDYDAFQSINSSFLVFDNRLIINNSFGTNDASIFAAGPLTKFSLRYHVDEWSHAHFSSKEVGQELAATLLPLFDPTAETEPGLDRLVPLYRQAKVQGGKLPGGYHYLHVSKPSATNQPPTADQEDVIVTGGVETGNYFCLRLDSYKLVGALTCLSATALPVSNYLCLFGKHEQLLGQLSSSYQQGLITDLYSFFKQSWCLAIYHDRFSDFEKELEQTTSSTDRHVDTLKRRAVEFLSFNRNLLPMFPSVDQL